MFFQNVGNFYVLVNKYWNILYQKMVHDSKLQLFFLNNISHKRNTVLGVSKVNSAVR